MAGHTMLGYVLAVGIKGAGSGERLLPALGALLIWVILLNGGTLAINSVFDRDEGDIGYLNAPPPLPRHLLARSEEHTSELQSQSNLVCRLLLEKKNNAIFALVRP